MKERGILFSAPMVRALLAGTKTQTRRICKAVKSHDDGEEYRDTDGWPLFDASEDGCGDVRIASPYGVPGDRLWVREAWADGGSPDDPARGRRFYFHADHEPRSFGLKWKPSIHMPRIASRITLEVVSVRVERLQAISEADALAEGVIEHQTLRPGTRACNVDGGMMHACGPVPVYRWLWESINGAGSWDANPWVWTVEFRRLP